jgi:hypothetical protein
MKELQQQNLVTVRDQLGDLDIDDRIISISLRMGMQNAVGSGQVSMADSRVKLRVP